MYNLICVSERFLIVVSHVQEEVLVGKLAVQLAQSRLSRRHLPVDEEEQGLLRPDGGLFPDAVVELGQVQVVLG